MIVHLYSDIVPEALNELINAINSLDPKDNIDLYFTCPKGGDFDVTRAIVDLINKNKDRITMHVYGGIVSSGMYIYLWSKCKKILLQDTRGMIHLPRMRVEIIRSALISGEGDKFWAKELDEGSERVMEELKGTPLTKKELKDIQEGKDVYFSYERLLKINE